MIILETAPNPTFAQDCDTNPSYSTITEAANSHDARQESL